MSHIIGDIETDGFLDKMTKIHCIVLHDPDKEKWWTFNQRGDQDGNIEDAVDLLNGYDRTFFHNGHGFDYPVLQKFTPNLKLTVDQMYDTLTMARAIFRDIRGADFDAIKKGKRHPDFAKMQLVGSHSLKAWGYRLGELKGSLADESGTTDWSVWTPEMEKYCQQDVNVTKKLLEAIERRQQDHPWECHELDTKFQHIISRQERHGFHFNEDEAISLYGELQTGISKLEKELANEFKPFFKRGKVFTPKRDNLRTGYSAGSPFSKISIVEFNPSSRDHIQDRLRKIYGWEPDSFGADGKASVDERILSRLSYPSVGLLLRYLQSSKICGMLSTGNQAWLKASRNKRIHGRVNTVGAATFRCTHSHPNLAQISSVRRARDGSILQKAKGGWGFECRSLFNVPAGFKLCGHDASGLELRCCAGYMAKYDNGAYSKLVVGGDVHSQNQLILDLNHRRNAKTYMYAFLYGSGDLRLGSIIFEDLPEDERNFLIKKHGRSGPAYDRELTKLGKASKKRIADGLPALSKLITAIKQKASATGELRAIDGRLLRIRSVHSAPNMLLQSAGALIMKRWLVILDQDLQDAGLIPMGLGGESYEFVANVHDEAQAEVREQDVEQYNKIAIAAFPKAGEYYNFRTPIEGEGSIGNNWAETH